MPWWCSKHKCHSMDDVCPRCTEEEDALWKVLRRLVAYGTRGVGQLTHIVAAAEKVLRENHREGEP